MPKYEAWLTTYASVQVFLETDTEYDLNDKKSLKKLRQRFLDEGENQAGLCHQCANSADLGDDFNESMNKDFAITLAEDE